MRNPGHPHTSVSISEYLHGIVEDVVKQTGMSKVDVLAVACKEYAQALQGRVSINPAHMRTKSVTVNSRKDAVERFRSALTILGVNEPRSPIPDSRFISDAMVYYITKHYLTKDSEK